MVTTRSKSKIAVAVTTTDQTMVKTKSKSQTTEKTTDTKIVVADTSKQIGKKKKKKKTNRLFKGKFHFVKVTLDTEALEIFLVKTYLKEFFEEHPTEAPPMELHFAGQAKWRSMTPTEQAPYVEEAKKMRAKSLEDFKKISRGEMI